jgi:hypothetical protein
MAVQEIQLTKLDKKDPKGFFCSWHELKQKSPTMHPLLTGERKILGV